MAVGIGILGLAFLLGLFGILAAGFVLLFRRGTWPIGLVLVGFPLVILLLGAAFFTVVRTVEMDETRVSLIGNGQRNVAPRPTVLRSLPEPMTIALDEGTGSLEQRPEIEGAQGRNTAETTTGETGEGEATSPPRAEAAGSGPSAHRAASTTAGNVALEAAKKITVPVNSSVTTFGLIVKALANAIDSELPNNISGEEALLALEKTVNDELPQGTSESGLITALGKVIGRAVAEKHNEIATEEEVEPLPPVPEWISRPSGKVDGVYQTVVKVGPFTTDLECENALKAALETAVNDYVGLYMGEKAQQAAVGLPRESLEREIVVEKFQQRIQTSVGPMVQLFALVKFDNRTNELLKESWRGIEIRDRLLVAGLGFGGLLSLITFVYGILRLDVATEGKMRGRLILGAIALCVLMGILIPRAFQDSQYRETLDQAHELVGLHAVAQEAATGATAAQGRPVVWVVILVPALLLLAGALLCFRRRTRKLGIGLLVCCGLVIGTGLFFLA